MISREEIANLSRLARLGLSEEEQASLHQDLENILQYVASLPPAESLEPAVRPKQYNVVRADDNPHPPGQYTDQLLESMAERQDQLMKVKRIIDRDS